MRIIKVKGLSVDINSSVLLLIPGLIFFKANLLAILVTIFIHEISHLCVAKFVGIKIHNLRFFVFGCVFDSNSFNGFDVLRELLVSAGGPLGNLLISLLLIVVREMFGYCGICNILIRYNCLMATFNLFPIMPLDGGRILRGILASVFGIKSSIKISTVVTYILCGTVFVFGIYSYIVSKSGILISLLMLYIIKSAYKEKYKASFDFMKGLFDRNKNMNKKKSLKAYIIVAYDFVKVSDILNKILPMRYHIIVVINNEGEFLATLSEQQLISELFNKGFDVTLGELL